MMQPRTLVTLLLLAPAGCATDERPANVLVSSNLDGERPSGSGGLLVSSFLPETDGAGYRLRIDGADVIWEMDDGWMYATYWQVGNGIGAWLPAGGHQIEIVDELGAVVAGTAAEVPADPTVGTLYTSTFIWRDADRTPRAWSFVPEVDPDPTQIRFDLKSTAAEPLIVERCSGGAECEALATVDPSGEWHGFLPVDPATGTEASPYLQLRLIGSPATSYLGDTRTEACRHQGFFVPAEIVTLTGPGATPDMRVTNPQATCY